MSYGKYTHLYYSPMGTDPGTRTEPLKRTEPLPKLQTVLHPEASCKTLPPGHNSLPSKNIATGELEVSRDLHSNFTTVFTADEIDLPSLDATQELRDQLPVSGYMGATHYFRR